MNDAEDPVQGETRRSLLKKSAVVGAVVATPQVLNISHAGAATNNCFIVKFDHDNFPMPEDETDGFDSGQCGTYGGVLSAAAINLAGSGTLYDCGHLGFPTNTGNTTTAHGLTVTKNPGAAEGELTISLGPGCTLSFLGSKHGNPAMNGSCNVYAGATAGVFTLNNDGSVTITGSGGGNGLSHIVVAWCCSGDPSVDPCM